MTFQNLPPELLNLIFDLGARQFLDAMNYQRGIWRSTFTLPSLKPIFRYHLSLSHVCATWRAVSIGFSETWNQIHLTKSALRDAPMTFQFMGRSISHPLSLEFSIRREIAQEDIAAIKASLNQFLPSNVHRIHSLRLAGPDVFISAVLDHFVDHTICYSPLSRSFTLSHLHIIQKSTPSGETFPLDLNLAAPHLTHLRTCGAPVFTFPRWYLEEVVLEEGILLSLKNLYHIYSKTPTKRLVLNGITATGGAPRARGIPSAQQSSITSIAFSNLQTPEEDPIIRGLVYYNFFCSSFPRNLHTLKLARLDDDLMNSLHTMLEVAIKSPPPIV